MFKSINPLRKSSLTDVQKKCNIKILIIFSFHWKKGFRPNDFTLNEKTKQKCIRSNFIRIKRVTIGIHTQVKFIIYVKNVSYREYHIRDIHILTTATMFFTHFSPSPYPIELKE